MNLPTNLHAPLRAYVTNKQPGSQERDPSYKPANFIP